MGKEKKSEETLNNKTGRICFPKHELWKSWGILKSGANVVLLIFHRRKDQWPGRLLYFINPLCSAEEHRYLLHDCILEIPLLAPCKLESKLWLFLTVTGEPAKPAVLLMVGVLGIRARLGMLLRSLSGAKEDNIHSQYRISNKHKQPQHHFCRKSEL